MKFRMPLLETGWSGSKGVYFRYNCRFFKFFWKPYSDGWFDRDGVWHKSKKFQFLTFTINDYLGHLDPRKGKNMNGNLNTVTNTDMAEAQKFLADDTDAFNAMLATKAIEDGTTFPPLGYITDADETADEPTKPTVH